MTDYDDRLEYAKRLKRSNERHVAQQKSLEYARAFWKQLVKNVGESEAKEIMRHLMGDKTPGRPKTDQDNALTLFIYAYIRHWGLNQSDGKIAIHIHESSPYYLQYKSGAVAVANSDYTEEDLSWPEDPIIGRTPIGMSLIAIKKRVERLRRWSIEEGLLPRTYAPRPYYRG
jgi:hypothetical protein